MTIPEIKERLEKQSAELNELRERNEQLAQNISELRQQIGVPQAPAIEATDTPWQVKNSTARR